MLRQAVFEIEGPVAVRYSRGGEGAFQEDTSAEPVVCLREGSGVTLLAYGLMVNHVLEAAELLHTEHAIETRVLKLNRIAPLDITLLEPWFQGGEVLMVPEDSFGAGCVGQRVSAILAEQGKAPGKLILRNLGKTFAPEGSVPQLEHSFGLDAAGIAAAIWEAVGQ